MFISRKRFKFCVRLSLWFKKRLDSKEEEEDQERERERKKEKEI
jgi:hypothetical protein